MATFTSYGAVARERQAKILADLREKLAMPGSEPDAETVRQVVAHLLKKAS
jgi:hypothetical protein